MQIIRRYTGVATTRDDQSLEAGFSIDLALASQWGTSRLHSLPQKEKRIRFIPKSSIGSRTTISHNERY